MGAGRHKLTATAIRAFGPGTYQDGAGLMLVKTETGGFWRWRFQADKRRRDMGLGAWPDLSLAEARKARDRWAAVLAQGIDPLAERERIRDDERAHAARHDPTLAEAVDEVFAAIQPTLRGGGARGRWRSPLDTHVLPAIGRERLSRLTAANLRDCLKPIWRTKHPTAEKAVQRLGVVFRRGRLMGLPCDPFVVEQARHMLGEVRHQVQHIAATPWQAIPALYARLGNGPSHLCLRLLILTAVRSDAGRGLRFDEVDGDLWTVPAERMKGAEGAVRDFRVPMTPAALAVVAEAREAAEGPFAFASRTGNPITTRGLEKALNSLGEAGRPHGFRSSFKDWTRETGLVPWEVAETALAHKVGGVVERAYARSDLLDQRREAMRLWADWVTSAP